MDKREELANIREEIRIAKLMGDLEELAALEVEAEELEDAIYSEEHEYDDAEDWESVSGYDELAELDDEYGRDVGEE